MDKTLARMAVLFAQEHPVSRTKLNKLLFFADVAHYIAHGKQISRSDYVKLNFGPVPFEIDEVRNWMVEKGFMRTSVGITGPYVQHSYEALPLADDGLQKVRDSFGAAIKIIDLVGKAFSSESASQLSELSHRYEPWKSADWYSRLDFSRATEDPSLRQMLVDRGILPA